MDFNITIKETNSLRIASIRDIYKDRQCINETLQRIHKYLNDNNICHDNIQIIVNFDIEYLESDIDLAVGVQM